jgi:hypothetical protein
MTIRTRIRTIKPEIWQDEKVCSLSRDARLLFVGLITMADDEGRLRAMPAALAGAIFPADEDAPKKVGSWLQEVSDVGLISLYAHGAFTYASLNGWGRHQRINRASSSTLPPPPSLNGTAHAH